MKPYRKFHPLQIRWNEPLGKPECPYMYRWIINFGSASIRLHHWKKPDDLRYPHDHPGWFITLVLKGSYDDISSDGTIDHLSRFSIRFRRATHAHSVKPAPEGCLTLLICGKKTRNWGFWIGSKFKRPLKYFDKYGHPPCEA